MAIPVSSTARTEPVDVVLENWQEFGLLKPSVARIHRLSSILEYDLLEEIGTVDDKHTQTIKEALRNLLDLG